MDKANQELLDQLRTDFGSVLNAVPALQKRQEELTSENVQLRDTVKKLDDSLNEALQRLARAEKLGDGEDTGLRVDPFTGRVSAKVSRDLGDFFVRVFKKDVRELSTTVGADGGYLVPKERIPELVQLITLYGAFRRDALIVPMRSNEQVWPNLASGVNVYWIVENNAAIESFPTFGEVAMSVKTMVGLTHVSAQLLEDADTDIGQLLVDLFARAVAQEEDHQGFRGTGAGADPFFGVLYAAGTNPVVMDAGDTAFADVTADHLLALQAAVPSNLAAGAKYYMHRSVFETLRRAKNADQDYIWQSVTAGAPSTIFGYPFELVEEMPGLAATAVNKPFMFFGNLRNAYLGDRHALEVARSDQFAFNKIQTFIRVHERIAVKVAQPAAFAVLKTAAA